MLHQTEPAVNVTLNEKGEYIVAALGELHLQV